MSEHLRIPATGHTPTPGFAQRLCDACAAQGRDLQPMRIFVMRAVDEDYGTIVYACRKCQHQTVGPEIPLEVLSRPAAEMFGVKT